MIKSKVYLIGAGPGDPGLITLKAIEYIKKADVVIYDYLINPELLNYAPIDAELIYVGKKAGQQQYAQPQINKLMVNKAKEKKTVVRLKGGDPFVFGRGGEETLYLHKHKIPFEIIPGISAALSVPAYAGIPITYRGISSTVTLVTGHETSNKQVSQIDWSTLAKESGTLVFLMGVSNLSQIVRKLIAHGKPSSTPIAIVRSGTTPQQLTVSGTLADIIEKAKQIGLQPPAVIIVGNVVRLRKELNWYETKPLFGKCILVTRAYTQATEFVHKLQQYGAHTIEFPTIEILPPDKYNDIDRAISQLPGYDWLIFTSVNGINFFLKRLFHLGHDIRALKGVRLCAIGPRTARLLNELRLNVEFVPSEYTAEAIVKEFSTGKYGTLYHKKILLARSDIACKELPRKLSTQGAIVEELSVYRTVSTKSLPHHIEELLTTNQIDVVTFTSASTVKNFVQLLKKKKKLLGSIRTVTIACIGPVTASTAKDMGLQPTIIAHKYTTDGLIEAILNYFSRK